MFTLCELCSFFGTDFLGYFIFKHLKKIIMASLKDKRNFASVVGRSEIISFKMEDIQAVYGMITETR